MACSSIKHRRNFTFYNSKIQLDIKQVLAKRRYYHTSRTVIKYEETPEFGMSRYTAGRLLGYRSEEAILSTISTCRLWID
jgi:hypothetical protein